MKVFKSLVTLLLVLAMVCECGVNALASGVASPVTPPTHTHTGGTATCKERAICDLCHRPYGELLPHTPEDIPGEAATCTEPGLTVGIKCSVCDTILQEQQAIPATGHAFTGWTTVIRATANKPGLEQRECGNCGIVETQEIPATGNPADGYRIGNGIYLINGEDKSVTLTAWDGAADKDGTADKDGMADKNGAADKDGTVTIPNTVTIDGVEYKVTEIGGGAFANNESIAKVIVGEFVGKIGEGAFAKDVNENETAWWEYTCAMDAETGALTGTGSKYEDNAESDVMTEIYADGEAVFSLEDGVLLWNDAKEDAGQGMRFVRVPDDED